MLADRGDMAILLVEQYYDFAEALADDYLVMERGEVIARGLGKNMPSYGVRHMVAIWLSFFSRLTPGSCASVCG